MNRLMFHDLIHRKGKYQEKISRHHYECETAGIYCSKYKQDCERCQIEIDKIFGR
jgi:hypothetical protein